MQNGPQKLDPAWLEFEAQVLHVQTDAVKTPTEASITWVQRLALNRWGLRIHGRPRVEKSGWLGGSFWNISWTVLKQFCGLNAMVARVWCHLTRMSSKIAKATVFLKPQTSAGEAPLQRRRRFAAKARRRNVSGPAPFNFLRNLTVPLIEVTQDYRNGTRFQGAKIGTTCFPAFADTTL